MFQHVVQRAAADGQRTQRVIMRAIKLVTSVHPRLVAPMKAQTAVSQPAAQVAIRVGRVTRQATIMVKTLVTNAQPKTAPRTRA